MKMKPYYILVLFLFSLSTNAKNLGVIAPTFPIAEMDMLDWIQARLKHLEQTGEMAKMEDMFKEQVKQSVRRPHPVEGITTTTSPSTFFVFLPRVDLLQEMILY